MTFDPKWRPVMTLGTVLDWKRLRYKVIHTKLTSYIRIVVSFMANVNKNKMLLENVLDIEKK